VNSKVRRRWLKSLLLIVLTHVTLVAGAAAQTSIFSLVPPQGELEVGESVRGALSTSDVLNYNGAPIEVWTFRGMPGQEIWIDIDSEFDSYLYLTGPGMDGTLSDDDGGRGCNARLQATLLENGTFFVVATALSSSTTGVYTLTVSEEPPATESYGCGETDPEALAQFADGVGRLSLGRVASGVLSSSDPVFASGRRAQGWKLVGRAGEAVSITMEAATFDAYLYLLSPDMDEVASNDDGGGGTNSRITYTFPQSGEYTVIASALGEGSTGAYTVEVERALSAQEVQPRGHLTSGVEMTGMVSSADPMLFDGRPGQVWTLTGRRGEMGVITLRSDTFDTFLYLVGPGLSQPLTDDDSAGDLDSRITVEFPESGEYRVVASPLGGNGGTYTITYSGGSGR